MTHNSDKSPKFKVGDHLKFDHIEDIAAQITEVTSTQYRLTWHPSFNSGSSWFSHSTIERNLIVCRYMYTPLWKLLEGEEDSHD